MKWTQKVSLIYIGYLTSVHIISIISNWVS